VNAIFSASGTTENPAAFLMRFKYSFRKGALVFQLLWKSRHFFPETLFKRLLFFSLYGLSTADNLK